MPKTYFKSAPTGPHSDTEAAGHYLAAFRQWLEQSGYRPETIRGRLRGAAQFVTWAEGSGEALAQFDEVLLSAFGRYLAHRGQLQYPNGIRTVRFLGARLFVTFLAAQGITPPSSKVSATPSMPGLLVKFCHWMRTQRGVSEPTLSNYTPILRDLLETLGDQAELFTAKRLREFVLNHVHRHGKGRAKAVVTAVRMFARFLGVIGWCEPGLEHAIPTIAEWRLRSLPRYLPTATVEHIIAACDDTTPQGVRDKAMILLMARLGLRAGDVAGLRFTDLDWQDGTLMVMGKNRRQTRLPLPQEVGDALLHYLESARPTTPCKHVFITARAPLKPVTRQAVGRTAARAIQRAGIDAPSLGSHVLRHSAATTMLRQGVSLQAIGEVLRHASPETTAHYAKVDQALLRQVVVPWPEVTSC